MHECMAYAGTPASLPLRGHLSPRFHICLHISTYMYTICSYMVHLCTPSYKHTFSFFTINTEALRPLRSTLSRCGRYHRSASKTAQKTWFPVKDPLAWATKSNWSNSVGYVYTWCVMCGMCGGVKTSWGCRHNAWLIMIEHRAPFNICSHSADTIFKNRRSAFMSLMCPFTTQIHIHVPHYTTLKKTHSHTYYLHINKYILFTQNIKIHACRYTHLDFKVGFEGDTGSENEGRKSV